MTKPYHQAIGEDVVGVVEKVGGVSHDDGVPGLARAEVQDDLVVAAQVEIESAKFESSSSHVSVKR